MEALQVFPCERCGKTFDYLYALKRHGKSCRANKPSKCKNCQAWFENQLAVVRHEIQCFKDHSPLSCSYCFKTFEHFYMLQRHYRATHRIKMSARNTNLTCDPGELIEYTSPDSEERLQNTSQQEVDDLEKTPSVYTIEIESISNNSNTDPNVKTLVYKIRQATNSAEIEMLPECEISDFDSVLQENVPVEEDGHHLESYEEVDIKVENSEYLDAEYYAID